MKLRPLIFWPHLAAGVLGGIVILIMSVTGVLLTYERQIVESVERSYSAPGDIAQAPLKVEELLEIGRREAPGEQHFELRFVNRPGSPVTIAAGRDRVFLTDPYTGAILRDGPGSTARFFDFVTRLHRWLAIDGEGFDAARATTAYGNLFFLLLILSGIYLWLPRVWNRPILKSRIYFNPKVDNSKARDFNWHHVFSFWALIPLMLICLTATVFYFPWANSAVYAAFGEEVPARDGGEHMDAAAPVGGAMTQQALFEAAMAHAAANEAADWYSIWMEASETPGAPVHFYVDRSIGHRPSLAYELTLDGADGAVLEFMRTADFSPGDQARGFVRFLHTGEVFGVVGQTIAGLSSFAACMLVYTGFALAWRRLVQPMLVPRQQRPATRRNGARAPVKARRSAGGARAPKG